MARKNGRPPLDPDANEPSARIGLSVTSAAYDQLYALARRHDVSVPEVIRRVLAHRAAVSHPRRLRQLTRYNGRVRTTERPRAGTRERP